MRPRRETDPLATLVPDALVAAVRPWGQAGWVFEGLGPNTRLWQVQVVGAHARLFNFQLLSNAREALFEGFVEKAKDLESLEAVAHMRLCSGAPPSDNAQDGDPDGVGQRKWHPGIYVAGETPYAALAFILQVLEFKRSKTRILQTPRLVLLQPPDLQLTSPPHPWIAVDDSSLPLPHPFGPPPPRGQRHVLCRLERTEGGGAGGGLGPYQALFYGGLYLFRAKFDENDIPGGMCGGAAAGGHAEYVRCFYLSDDLAGRAKLTMVLCKILGNLPVFFINAVLDAEDELAAWFLTQPSVVLGETETEEAM